MADKPTYIPGLGYTDTLPFSQPETTPITKQPFYAEYQEYLKNFDDMEKPPIPGGNVPKSFKRFQKDQRTKQSQKVLRDNIISDPTKAYEEGFTQLPFRNQMLAYFNPVTGLPLDTYEAGYYGDKADFRMKGGKEYLKDIADPTKPRIPMTPLPYPFTSEDPLSGGIAALSAGSAAATAYPFIDAPLTLGKMGLMGIRNLGNRVNKGALNFRDPPELTGIDDMFDPNRKPSSVSSNVSVPKVVEGEKSTYDYRPNTTNTSRGGPQRVVSLADEAVANTPGFSNPDKTYSVKNLIDTFSKYKGVDGNPNKFVRRELVQALDDPTGSAFTINGKNKITMDEFNQARNNNRLVFTENHAAYPRYRDEYKFDDSFSHIDEKWDYGGADPGENAGGFVRNNFNQLEWRLENTYPLRSSDEVVNETGEFTIQATRGKDAQTNFDLAKGDSMHEGIALGDKGQLSSQKYGSMENRINATRYAIVNKNGVDVFELTEIQSPYTFSGKLNPKDFPDMGEIPRMFDIGKIDLAKVENIDEFINAPVHQAKYVKYFDDELGIPITSFGDEGQAYIDSVIDSLGTKAHLKNNDWYLNPDKYMDIHQNALLKINDPKVRSQINDLIFSDTSKNRRFDWMESIHSNKFKLRDIHNEQVTFSNPTTKQPLAQDNRHFDLSFRRGLQLAHENVVDAVDIPINAKALYRQMVGGVDIERAGNSDDILKRASRLGELYKKQVKESIKRMDTEYGVNIKYEFYTNPDGLEFIRIPLTDQTAKIQSVLKYERGGAVEMLPLKYGF